jgi:hypothetical protein
MQCLGDYIQNLRQKPVCACIGPISAPLLDYNFNRKMTGSSHLTGLNARNVEGLVSNVDPKNINKQLVHKRSLSKIRFWGTGRSRNRICVFPVVWGGSRFPSARLLTYEPKCHCSMKFRHVMSVNCGILVRLMRFVGRISATSARLGRKTWPCCDIRLNNYMWKAW